MNWTVYFTEKAAKQTRKLSQKIMSALDLLVADLKSYGGAPGKGWPNYGILRGKKGDLRHCHLIKGKPTYVCCWEVTDKHKRIIEVFYVGTHENAPY